MCSNIIYIWLFFHARPRPQDATSETTYTFDARISGPQLAVPADEDILNHGGPISDRPTRIPHPLIFIPLCIVACVVMFGVSMWQNGWAFEPYSQNPMFGPSAQVLMKLGVRWT